MKNVSQKLAIPLFCSILSVTGCIKSKTTKHASGGQAASDVEKKPTPKKEAVKKVKVEPIVDDGKLDLKYPVVLHHGFLGSDTIGSFDGLAEHLREKGVIVLEAEVSAVNSVSYRARQLKDSINKLLIETQADKVNIIAHSMGGIDARYLISSLHYKEFVASLTTMSAPHRGSYIADIFNKLSISQQETLEHAMDFLGTTYNQASDMQNASSGDAIDNLTEDYMTEVFNVENPDASEVYYQSYAAKSGFGAADKMKITLMPTWAILKPARGDNDGLVTVESAKWGVFKGVLEADHLDLVGFKLGDSKSAPFEFLPFYVKLIEDLITKGF